MKVGDSKKMILDYPRFVPQCFDQVALILDISISMDVTTENFGEVRELIQKKLLPKALYLSYDLEFTGLRYEKFQRDHINYLPFEKYKKLKYVAETYQILQLGLSIVTFEGKLKVYPFNFYLFPRNPAFYDKNLTLQLGCVKFNASNGMDWNKWIREGINYVKLSEVSSIEDQQKSRTFRDILDNLPADLEDYGKEFIRKIDEVSREKEGTEHAFIMPKQAIESTFSLAFYKYIEEKRMSLSLTEKEDRLIIKKIPQGERNKIFQKHKQTIFGFSLLFEQIWKMKLPMVGHNCNLDLLYVYHNFVAPLPESYFQYKRALRESGNTFFDTKYIAVQYPELAEEGSRLEDLVAWFRKKYEKVLTTLTLDPPFDRYSLDKAALHEAGYDSYITAWVYQQAMKLHQDVDSKCQNRLNLLNSFFYIDLSQDQDEINTHFAENILRVNISLDQKQDIRVRRADEVKIIRKGLEQFKDSYNIYEGYRQIFIEVRANRKSVIGKIFQMMKKKQIQEISTFPSYLNWQKERAFKEAKREEYTRNNARGFQRRPKKEDDSSSNQPPKKWKKMEN